MEHPNLTNILDRIATGTYSPSDIEALSHAYLTGGFSVATGEQAVAMGGDANDAVIVTGDYNIIQIFHGSQAEMLQDILRPEQTENKPVASLYPEMDMNVNPFEYGKPVPPERFFGRHKQRADVRNRVGAISPQCVSIIGMRRNGKTSLLHYIKAQSQEFCPPPQRPLIVSLDFQSSKFHTSSGVIEGLRRAIEKETGCTPWQKDENEDAFVIEESLERLRDDNWRLIIMIDEFERIADRLDSFQDWGEDWRAKISAGYLTLIIATQHPLNEIYQTCGLTSPFDNVFERTILGTLEPHAWRALVCNGFSRSGRDIEVADLELIDELAGGLPFYTQMAATLLWQHYQDYRQVRAAFALQAKDRFKELWNSLNAVERRVVTHAAGITGSTKPPNGTRANLEHHGILRSDGYLFSSAFAEFLRRT